MTFYHMNPNSSNVVTNATGRLYLSGFLRGLNERKHFKDLQGRTRVRGLSWVYAKRLEDGRVGVFFDGQTHDAPVGFVETGVREGQAVVEFGCTGDAETKGLVEVEGVVYLVDALEPMKAPGRRDQFLVTLRYAGSGAKSNLFTVYTRWVD